MDETGPGFFNFPKNVPVYFRPSPFIFEIHDLLIQEKKMPRGLRVGGGSYNNGFLQTEILTSRGLTTKGS